MDYYVWLSPRLDREAVIHFKPLIPVDWTYLPSIRAFSRRSKQSLKLALPFRGA